MPSREWPLRIQDIMESIDDILQRTANMTFEEFSNNRTIIKAVLYDFGIIGEAAKNVPHEIQSRYPHIPWHLMGDMRNVIFHEYFQVKLPFIWRTIQNDLTSLHSQLQEILDNENKPKN